MQQLFSAETVVARMEDTPDKKEKDIVRLPEEIASVAGGTLSEIPRDAPLKESLILKIIGFGKLNGSV